MAACFPDRVSSTGLLVIVERRVHESESNKKKKEKKKEKEEWNRSACSFIPFNACRDHANSTFSKVSGTLIARTPTHRVLWRKCLIRVETVPLSRFCDLVSSSRYRFQPAPFIFQRIRAFYLFRQTSTIFFHLYFFI